MLPELIRAEWDRRRLALLALLGLYLAVPLRYAAALSGGFDEKELDGARALAVLLVAAAVCAAAAWGSGAWAAERRGRWAYFLALPVGRARLFALRYLAGLVWLALPVAALALASYAVAAAAVLPRFVHAYPEAYSAWMAAASWLAYTAGFVAGSRWEHPGRAAGLGVAAFFALEIAARVLQLASPWTYVAFPSALSPLRLLPEATLLLGS